MFISAPLILLSACNGPTDEPVKPIYVDGELYTLDLRVITPSDQVIDRIGKINQLSLVVRQANGETTSHSLVGDYALDKAENNVIPPLDEARLSLVGSYTEDDTTNIVYHGTSSPISLVEGELTVPIFVAKNDHIGRLGNLPTPNAFAPLVAVGDGRYYAFGGGDDGVFTAESSTTINRLDLSEPNPNLSSVSLTEPLISQPNGTGWMTHTADIIPEGNDYAEQILLVGGGPVFPTIEGAILSDVFATDKAYRFDPNTEILLNAGSMNHARFDHRSAVMPSGEILITGGFGADGLPISSIDIYSPGTDLWATRSQVLSSGAAFHAMARYQDEGVLTCGGLTGDDDPHYTNQCNFIDATHNIQTAPSMDRALLFTDMITLEDGRILRTGGLDATALDHTTFRPDNIRSTPTAAIYENGEWRTLETQMKRARAMHSTALLPGGRVLIVGGVSGISSAHTSREKDYNGLLYDHAEALACVEIFDLGDGPGDESFTLEDPRCVQMETEGSLPQRTLLPSLATDPTYGTLILGGIGSDRGGSVDSALIYHPAYSTSNQGQ